ncbi:ribosomal protein S18-alanine N-acetyltransferase [Candidatus Peregrinibacteria bacterium]|nr:ribosomal protein S18-alanine N-acetyltransferase [Candidatus Peregrinibacteria bacterium]
MIRHDLPYVLHISGRSFDWDWSENDFLQCLRQRDCIGMVAEHGCSNIVGYMIYQLKKAKFHILNFAVHPAWRRMNVGGAMVEKLVAMLDNRRRTRLTMEIRESNLPGQSFFRKKEFAATGVTRNFYDDTGEDAYRMQYRAYPPNELELQEEQEGNQYVNDENGDRS